MNRWVHSLEFHKTSYWVYQLLLYVRYQGRDSLQCTIAFWNCPVSNMAAPSRDNQRVQYYR